MKEFMKMILLVVVSVVVYLPLSQGTFPMAFIGMIMVVSIMHLIFIE